jgi:hypothetical protein
MLRDKTNSGPGMGAEPRKIFNGHSLIINQYTPYSFAAYYGYILSEDIVT